ncbi:DUF3006 domain-containing protein [Halorussus marinus]|uniref:DUF3006 domain-containing protein n=1 Tax=Halorussus marinus TaxID=2505976 RepID=UPI001092CBEF|nr:DUF3006 domain-containing protein [Halorussus marinus]
MLPDGRYAAVLDRFEGERAVLLVEDGGTVLDEFAVRTRRLPADSRQNAVFRVTVRNGHLVSARPDPEASERRLAEAQDRFDRLAERPPDESDEDA